MPSAVEDLARFLGIAVGEQLHRSLEVREEHGDLLALALERPLAREDLLGEVLGGVALWRREPLGGLGRDRRAAGAAEALVGLELDAAARARQGEASSALLAESDAVAIVRMTPATPQKPTPPIAATALRK